MRLASLKCWDVFLPAIETVQNAADDIWMHITCGKKFDCGYCVSSFLQLDPCSNGFAQVYTCVVALICCSAGVKG